MRKATFFYLLRRGLLTGAGGFIRDGLVMASKFITQGLTHPAQGSAEFDGASDYIKTNSLPLSNWDNFTYSAWVNMNDFQSTAGILSFGNSSNNTPLSILEVRTNATINFFHRNDSSTFAQALSTKTLNANQWHFVVGTRENNTFTLYIDGSVAATGSNNVSTPTLNTFNIGRLERTTAINYFDGNLANVAIWNRALSSDEINSVMWKGYQSLTDNEKSGLKAWYSLDNIDGSSVPDSSGNGNNGTAY